MYGRKSKGPYVTITQTQQTSVRVWWISCAYKNK